MPLLLSIRWCSNYRTVIQSQISLLWFLIYQSFPSSFRSFFVNTPFVLDSDERHDAGDDVHRLLSALPGDIRDWAHISRTPALHQRYPRPGGTGTANGGR